MTSLLVAIGILAAVAALWYWGNQPVIHHEVTPIQFPRFVNSFLDQMGPGSQLHADREDGPGFLQFVVTQALEDRRAVEFGLPDIAWSTQRFDATAAALASEGFEVSVERGEGDVSRFLRVFLTGARADVATSMVQVMITAARGLAWQPDERFRVRMLGALAPNFVAASMARIRTRGG